MRTRRAQLILPATSADSERASILGASLVIALCITLILAGLLNWARTESQLTRASLLATKATYAAESVCNYAAAGIQASCRNNPVIVPTAYTSSGNPPVLPSSSAITPAPSADAKTLFALAATSVKVGSFSTPTTMLIDPTNPVYANDPLKGQTVTVRHLSILGSATATDLATRHAISAHCEQVLEVRDVPLFNYAIFYNLDLEFWPGKDFDIFGPVFTNRNLYMMSCDGVNLRFHGTVATAADVFHAVPPGSGRRPQYGEVSIDNSGGVATSMNLGGSWLDSLTTDWASKATIRWQGNLVSHDHGIVRTDPASIPAYTPDDPTTAANELNNSAHDLVEPSAPTGTPGYTSDSMETQKYANRASLVISVNGSGTLHAYKYVADEKNGTYVRDIGSGPAKFRRAEISVPASLATVDLGTKFYDARRGAYVHVVDIDVGNLKQLLEVAGKASQWTNGTTSVGFDPQTEWNGVLYINQLDPVMPGVRLVDAANVPNVVNSLTGGNGGFTVATNVPLYIWGNFGARTMPLSAKDVKKPAPGEAPSSIAADAITVLSNAWSDANSATGSLNSRIATNTVVAAALLTGIVPTNNNGNGTYSGGVQTFMRFIENWNNATFAYRGSLVCMFQSEIATEPWAGINVYSPPTRWWGFNNDFALGRLPPGTPMTRTFRRLSQRDLTSKQFDAEFAALK